MVLMSAHISGDERKAEITKNKKKVCFNGRKSLKPLTDTMDNKAFTVCKCTLTYPKIGLERTF